MTQDELKMVLEALELCNGAETVEGVVIYTDKAITAIKEALAQPERDNTYVYASSLATAIWQKHYIKESPKFALLDTTEGVLTQIDNMTCGLVREKPAQPEQEPVGQLLEDAFGRGQVMWFNKPKDESMLYTTTPQRTEPVIDQSAAIRIATVLGWTPPRTWVGLTDEEISEVLGSDIHDEPSGELRFIRAIEAKLKERNQ